MPRSVLLDPNVDLNVIEGTGLLLGGYLPHHILGMYAAPTPVEQEEEGDEQEEKQVAKAVLDVPWMMEHCKQVLRLLPGGLHVLGFIINTSEDVQSKSESKIRKLLSGIRTLDPVVEEPFLIYTKSKKAGSLQGDSLVLQDFKKHESGLEFVQLDTNLILDCPVALHCDQDSDRMLLSHAEKAVEKFERTLSTSTCIFDNKILRAEDLIVPSQLEVKKKGGKSKNLDDTLDSEDGEMVKFSVTVLAKDDNNTPDNVVIEDNNVRLKLLGRMKSRCYVAAGTTVQQCTDYLVQDVKRSIRGRIQLHCDSLVGEEVEPGNLPVIHEPPRRVFIRLPGAGGLTVSDYLYPGEGPEDSVDSIKEIFGFTPTEDDIEDDLELVAAAKDVKRDVLETKEKKGFLGSSRQIALSVGIAGISAVLAWLKIRSSPEQAQDDQ